MGLGWNTLVFTTLGLVKIENIERYHLLWDGYAWVDHGGRIYEGVRDCIEFQGVKITPEHIVLCNDEWHSVDDMKDSITLRGQTAVAAPYLYLKPIEHYWTVPNRNDSCAYSIMSSGAYRRFTILTIKGPVVVHNREGPR